MNLILPDAEHPFDLMRGRYYTHGFNSVQY
jgi:hypothetical protein